MEGFLNIVGHIIKTLLRIELILGITIHNLKINLAVNTAFLCPALLTQKFSCNQF